MIALAFVVLAQATMPKPAPVTGLQKFQQHTTDEEIVDAITNGLRKKKMPAFKNKLSPEEIQALVPFVRAFGKK